MSTAENMRDNQSEGPLEKQVHSLGERAEATKKSLAGSVDQAAGSVEQMGESMSSRVGDYAQMVPKTASNYLRSLSDYIEGLNVSAGVDRMVRGIQNRPVESLSAAFGAGLVLGFLLRRR